MTERTDPGDPVEPEDAEFLAYIEEFYGPPSRIWPAVGAVAHRPSCGRLWRVTHRLWLLLPLFGCGCGGGASLAFVGLILRRPAVSIFGLTYFFVGFTALLWLGNTSGTLANALFAVLLATWLASLVHACFINGALLRHQISQIDRRRLSYPEMFRRVTWRRLKVEVVELPCGCERLRRPDWWRR